jgi:hypothetical protein
MIFYAEVFPKDIFFKQGDRRFNFSQLQNMQYTTENIFERS